MHPSFEIDAKMRDYIEHRVPLQQLRDWFRAAAGPLFDMPEGAPALEIAAALQLALVEYDQGSFSERQMRRYLKQATSGFFRGIAESSTGVDPSPPLTSSSNETLVASALHGSSNTTVITSLLIPTGTSS